MIGLVASVALAAILRPLPAAWWLGEDPFLVKVYAFLWFPTSLRSLCSGSRPISSRHNRSCRGRMPSVALLTGRPLQLMGKISYSAYFWHFAVLDAASRLVHMKAVSERSLPPSCELRSRPQPCPQCR